MYVLTEAAPNKSLISHKTEAPATLDSTVDKNFFNALMNTTQPPGTGVMTMMGLALTDRSTETAGKLKRVKRGLSDLSLNKDTKARRELTSTVYEAHEDLRTGIKVLNKCVQFFDKVSNLQ